MSAHKYLERVFNWLRALHCFAREREWLKALLVFAGFFAFFALAYLPDSIISASDDHFFHFRFATLMQQQGLLAPFEGFRSIYFSHAAEGLYYPYYNFLFYLAILPFTYITPLYLGIKLYAVCAATIFFTALYITARSFRVSYASLWVLALFSLMSTHSVWRLFLSRPYVLAPIFLLAILACLHKRRWVSVGVLSFLYFYWYDATFFFPVVIAFVHAAFHELYMGQRQLRGVMAATMGSVVALFMVYALAPGFFTFIWGVITAAAATPLNNTSMPVGGEVYPIDILNYVQLNAVLFALLLVGLCVELYSYTKYRRAAVYMEDRGEASIRATLLFLIFGLLSAAALVTGRFIDYIFPFLGLYIVLALSSLWAQIRFQSESVRKSSGAGLVVALTFLSLSAATSFDSFMAQAGSPAQLFEGVGGWLAENSQPGEIVFNANWSWFPQLYYYSPYTNYVTGLDPHFLYDYDPNRYWLWFHMTSNGYVCAAEICPDSDEAAVTLLARKKTAEKWYADSGNAMADVLLRDFSASYVVSSYEFERFNKVMDSSKRFEKVYGGSRTYYIYKVLP